VIATWRSGGCSALDSVGPAEMQSTPTATKILTIFFMEAALL
jgi:hypothetical protein